MKCPYCSEDVSDEAIVRRRRDLAEVRSLLDRLAEVTRRLEAHESDAPTPAAVSAQANPSKSTPSGRDKAVAVIARLGGRVPSVAPATAVLLALIALLSAHFLIIIQYDLPLVWLRLASIVLPCGFGFLFRQRPNESFVGDLIIGVVLAAAAILAMSAVVAKVDNVPLLPTDMHGWAELAQYGASIAFAFLTGTVLRQIVTVMHDPTVRTSELAYLAARYAKAKITGVAAGDPGDARRDRHLKRIGIAERVITAGTAIGSALVSIWTGLSSLL